MSWYECFRCNRDFNSHSALRQHIRDSSNHHICYDCNGDFEDDYDLEKHFEDNHYYCSNCRRFFDSPQEQHEHDISEHNMCTACGDFFSSESNLRNHRITHMEKNIDCPGCSRCFATQSAMVLHLETGTCPSGTDRERVTDLAFECRQSEHYRSGYPDYDFECPECAVPFSYMSGLFQHVQSKACDEDLSHHSPLGIFLRFLRPRV